LSCSSTAGHASPGISIDIGVRCREAVAERLQKYNDLILLHIRQAEMTSRHVQVLRDLWRRPAVYLFYCSRRAVSRRDRLLVHVAGVVEVYELLQTLDVAVMEELLLEVWAWSFGGRTLWWHQGHIARCHRLHLAVGD